MPVQSNTQRRSTSARVATAWRAYTLTQTYSRYNVTSLSKKVNSSTLDFSKSSTQGVSLCFSPECGSCVRVHNGMCVFLTLYMRVFFVLLRLLVFFVGGEAGADTSLRWSLLSRLDGWVLAVILTAPHLIVNCLLLRQGDGGGAQLAGWLKWAMYVSTAIHFASETA